MDQLPPFGRHVPEVIGPTFEIYGKILHDNASAIHATHRQEFTYGTHARHKLDVYTPSHPSKPGNNPVLMFAYGGGFVSGDKRLNEIPDDLVYSNLGYFFADKLGLDTVVIDYRLIGHGAKYPTGAEDVDLALQWVEKHFADRETLYLLGNSAGGVHLATWLFGPGFVEHRDWLIGVQTGATEIKIGAVGFLGTPFMADPKSVVRPMLNMYYGEADPARPTQPQELMLDTTARLSKEEIGRWPRLCVMISELDPEDYMRDAGKAFAELWESKGGRCTVVDVAGHNHISPTLALGTGVEREEAWGYEFGQWLKQ